MSQSYVPVHLRQALEETAHNRCEYCQTQALLIGMPLEIDHIIPEVEGGETIFENLALACARCNQYKSSRTAALDPQTNELIRFFHPRQDQWAEHFRWSTDKTYIEGITSIGRVTAMALNLNNPFILRARQLWVQWGYHPPK